MDGLLNIDLAGDTLSTVSWRQRSQQRHAVVSVIPIGSKAPYTRKCWRKGSQDILNEMCAYKRKKGQLDKARDK